VGCRHGWASSGCSADQPGSTGKEADGSVVITGNTGGSKVVVPVGKLGDPALGAEIAREIKAKAAAFVKKIDFKPSAIAFDAQFNK
jgi:hypothetical protein